MSSTKGCHNCVHRYGGLITGREFWQCSRVGYYTSTEMKFGGRCADGKQGVELRLWAQRPSLLGRIINLVRVDGRCAESAGGGA